VQLVVDVVADLMTKLLNHSLPLVALAVEVLVEEFMKVTAAA
jgi:hypothetical protein